MVAQNAAWWQSLSAKERWTISEFHPEWISNLDGIPATARDQANRGPPAPCPRDSLPRCSRAPAVSAASTPRPSGCASCCAATRSVNHRSSSRPWVCTCVGWCETITELEEQIDTAFHAHPDAKIVTSVPGLGVALGARLLAEIGDDRSRFADARGLKAFAGAAPVARASGQSSFVHARRAKNDRIAAAGYVWALAAIRHDPDWEARYRARRDAGDHHVTALCKLFNGMLGTLHHCLVTNQPCNPAAAFRPPRPPDDQPRAA